VTAHHSNIACLLASGLSRRFGKDNKLLADFKKAPMITHAANAISNAGFDKVYAVVNEDPALHRVLSDYDIELIINKHAENGQSQAIKLAANKAIAVNANSLTIALADMPFVTSEHLSKIKSLADNANAVVSNNGINNSPPALFSAQLFEELKKIEGDQGALALLKTIENVRQLKTEPDLLRDIDTRQMLKGYS